MRRDEIAFILGTKPYPPRTFLWPVLPGFCCWGSVGARSSQTCQALDEHWGRYFCSTSCLALYLALSRPFLHSDKHCSLSLMGSQGAVSEIFSKLAGYLCFNMEIKCLNVTPEDTAPLLVIQIAAASGVLYEHRFLICKMYSGPFPFSKIVSLLSPTALQCQTHAHKYPSINAFCANPSFGFIIHDCSFYQELHLRSFTGHPSC